MQTGIVSRDFGRCRTRPTAGAVHAMHWPRRGVSPGLNDLLVTSVVSVQPTGAGWYLVTG